MGHTLRRPWSSKSYGATFVVLAMGFLSACGPMREEAHQANQPSIMHFVRYRHPPIAPPMVFVANRDRHFVNGVLYASTWGTTDKTLGVRLFGRLSLGARRSIAWFLPSTPQLNRARRFCKYSGLSIGLGTRIRPHRFIFVIRPKVPLPVVARLRDPPMGKQKFNGIPIA